MTWILEPRIRARFCVTQEKTVQTVAIWNCKDTTDEGQTLCDDIHIPVSTCGQHVTTTIYRALHNSVERDKERTDNITNLNVSVLPNTRFLCSMFNHSPLHFTFVTSRTCGLELLEWVQLVAFGSTSTFATRF